MAGQGAAPVAEALATAGAPHVGMLRLQRLLAATGHWVEEAIFVACSVLLVFLSAVLFLQVLFRYVLLEPLPWSEEAARFGLVWLGMLAAVLAARKGLHFVFRWATLVLPAAARAWLRQAVNLLVVVFLGMVFLQSLTYLDIVANQTAPATRLNMRVPYAGVPVGAAVLLIIYVLEILDAVCGVITKQRLSAREHQETDVYALLSGAESSGSP